MEGHRNVGGAGLPSTPEEDTMVAKIDNNPDDGAKKDLGVRWGRPRGRLDGDMGGCVQQLCVVAIGLAIMGSLNR